jgi:hypothetical protein
MKNITMKNHRIFRMTKISRFGKFDKISGNILKELQWNFNFFLFSAYVVAKVNFSGNIAFLMFFLFRSFRWILNINFHLSSWKLLKLLRKSFWRAFSKIESLRKFPKQAQNKKIPKKKSKQFPHKYDPCDTTPNLWSRDFWISTMATIARILCLKGFSWKELLFYLKVPDFLKECTWGRWRVKSCVAEESLN